MFVCLPSEPRLAVLGGLASLAGSSDSSIPQTQPLAASNEAANSGQVA